LLESEWRLFKEIELAGGPIPNKYRERIGIAVSAVTKCNYCAISHTEIAKRFGATDDEIQAAVHYTQNSAGWSTYINGMQMDF
jgi:AhpD family alkylhydroperoxidase